MEQPDTTVASAIASIMAITNMADLDKVREFADTRRKQLATLALNDLKVGDYVTIRNVRPKYLCGESGEVDRIDTIKGKHWVWVRLDSPRPQTLNRYGRTIQVSHNCVEPSHL